MYYSFQVSVFLLSLPFAIEVGIKLGEHCMEWKQMTEIEKALILRDKIIAHVVNNGVLSASIGTLSNNNAQMRIIKTYGGSNTWRGGDLLERPMRARGNLLLIFNIHMSKIFYPSFIFSNCCLIWNNFYSPCCGIHQHQRNTKEQGEEEQPYLHIHYVFPLKIKMIGKEEGKSHERWPPWK